MSDWPPKSEKELAAELPNWFSRIGMKGYPEVQWEPDCPIADFVAVNHSTSLVAVFECKLTLSVKLLRQAHWWCDKADYVSIVLPEPKGAAHIEERDKILPLLQDLGIGLVEIGPPGQPGLRVIVKLKARRQSVGRSGALMALCCDGHIELGQAGSQQGPRWSQFQQTLARLGEYVKANAGCTLKEAVKSIEHHYANDSQAIQKLLTYLTKESGLRGIRAVTEGGIAKLYAE